MVIRIRIGGRFDPEDGLHPLLPGGTVHSSRSPFALLMTTRLAASCSIFLPMRRLAALLAAASMSLACSRGTSEGTSPPTSTSNSPVTPSPVTTTTAVQSAVPSSSAIAAGDVPPLTYRPYTNTRYGFFVDAPTFFKPSPPPTNGDGQEWTWGGRSTMTASAIHNPGSMTMQEMCKEDLERKGTTMKSVSATTCLVSGKDAGKVYWQRTLLSGDVFYSLRLVYDERLKEDFDPLVTHVNASWKVPDSH
jgi:hypothetical protein